MQVNQKSIDEATELRYKTGDTVNYTNDSGVVFKDKTVTGIYAKECNLHKYGYRYFINKDSFWMPVKEANLSQEA